MPPAAAFEAFERAHPAGGGGPAGIHEPLFQLPLCGYRKRHERSRSRRSVSQAISAQRYGGERCSSHRGDCAGKKHDARPGQYTVRSAAGGSDGLPAYVMTNTKLPLPGMAAISLYMWGLALVGVAGVLTHHYPTGALILCSIFAVAGLGLVRMVRWGWALTLGAVFCSICYWCYSFFRFHQPQ